MLKGPGNRSLVGRKKAVAEMRSELGLQGLIGFGLGGDSEHRGDAGRFRMPNCEKLFDVLQIQENTKKKRAVLCSSHHPK